MNPEPQLTYVDLDLEDHEIYVLLHANLYNEAEWKHYLDHWIDDVMQDIIIPFIQLHVTLPVLEYYMDYDADRGSPSCRVYIKIPVISPYNEDMLLQQFNNIHKPLIYRSFHLAFSN